MPAIRGLTVSVGQWYADLLKITLWRNMRHFTSCVVVTAPDDPSIAVARSVPGAIVSTTNAFTEPGANGVVPRFNKGRAIEEAGFEFMGRHGWITVWDSDCLFPDSIPLDRLKPGFLHGARRRILADPTQWTPGLDWNTCPLHRDGGPIGFFQLAHADDPAIKDKRPWYDVSYPHGGGCDHFYMTHWPTSKMTVLPFDVLHLGVPDRHWFGADEEGKALMARYVTENQWRRAMMGLDPEVAARAGELPGRLVIPGYEPSQHVLPFERRAEQQRQRTVRP